MCPVMFEQKDHPVLMTMKNLLKYRNSLQFKYISDIVIHKKITLTKQA